MIRRGHATDVTCDGAHFKMHVDGSSVSGNGYFNQDGVERIITGTITQGEGIEPGTPVTIYVRGNGDGEYALK